MNNPIINPSTLTEEQRAQIRELWMENLHKDAADMNKECQCIGVLTTLRIIFGIEFFKKGE